MASRLATAILVAMVTQFHILEVQMAQISNMKVISLMVDFIKFWHLSIEFYSVWQKVALHNRTQYLNAKVVMIFKKG